MLPTTPSNNIVHAYRKGVSEHDIAQFTSVSSKTSDLSQQRCLLIKHSDGWQDDRCESWLHDHGGIVETVVCIDGTNLPDPGNYSRVILYGGQSCVNDVDYKSCLHHEMRFIESALKNNIPCFGICLGAQLIAHVLGATVKRLPCGTPEFGYSRITPTDAGKNFMPQPCTMLQWHCEGFDLPKDCERLARGDVFPNQAFRYNSHTYGVQFHPEVTSNVLQVWQQRVANDENFRTDELNLRRQLKDCAKYTPENEQWLGHFMHLWVNS